jgi:hypothetical protein
MLLFAKKISMRHLLLMVCICVFGAANAQFSFYGQAGANYTDIRITRTTGIEKDDGGFGWQMIGGLEYHTQFGYFLYMGAGLRHQAYERDSLSYYYQDTVYQYLYRPLFINFPFGIGWKFPLDKNLSLKAYGGMNMQVGLGGSVTKNVLYYSFDSATNSSSLVREESSKHGIKYGRKTNKQYAYDLANTNWDLQLGVGLTFMNSAEVAVAYHHGFTNFLPNKDQAYEINKMSFIEVNLKFYFPNAYLDERKKKK